MTRNSTSNLSRKAASRRPNTRIHMVCEGEVTEPKYLRDFFRSLENRIAVIGTLEGGGGVPKTIVNRCIEIKQQVEVEAKRSGFANLDEVWAVFDVDEHDVGEAITVARQNSIKCAISNPCIEVWGLLHASEVDRPWHRHEAQRALSLVMPNYHHDKNPIFDWHWCYPKVEQATRHAVRGRSNRENEGSLFPQDVPSSNFDRLLATFDNRLLSICPTPTWCEWS